MLRGLRWTMLGVLLGITAPARAELILNISSTTVPQGGSGAIDLTVATNGTPTALGEYNFDIYINGAGTHNAPALTFVNPSDVNYRNLPNYVFYNNSSGGPVAYSNQSGSAGLHQEVGGGDTIDLNTATNDVTVGNGQTFLLAHLNLAASPGAVVGDVYTIEVFANPNPVSSATGYAGVFSSTPPSDFELPAGTPTVTIGPAVSVPEPHSMLLLLGGMASLTARRFWSRRQPGSTYLAPSDSA